MYNGLSLDQAPPISVVMRFFLTVPFFGIALSILLLLDPEAVSIPSHPYSLAVIHLLFLGVITMSMIGALFQMQSVLGGRSIPSARGNAFLIHLFLLIGILCLSGAFLLGIVSLFVIASIFLAAALLYTAQLILPLLFGGVSHETLRGMRLALIALSITAILGVIMASEYANSTFSDSHGAIRTAHYSLGLIGWVGALIIAVAFQVVEMFYVTAPYSSWCKRNVFRILALSLLLKIIGLLGAFAYNWVFDLIIGALLVGFVVTTLKRLLLRKRRVSDVSIWFWISGMILVSISIAAYALFVWSATEELARLSLIGFALFALAIILAMMGKIVPFLVWFHLNSAGYMDAPIMSNIIPMQRVKVLFWLFTITSVLVLGGVFYPLLMQIGALSSTALFALLLLNLIKALKLYRYTLVHGTRFEQM